MCPTPVCKICTHTNDHVTDPALSLSEFRGFTETRTDPACTLLTEGSFMYFCTGPEPPAKAVRVALMKLQFHQPLRIDQSAGTSVDRVCGSGLLLSPGNCDLDVLETWRWWWGVCVWGWGGTGGGGEGGRLVIRGSSQSGQRRRRTYK